MISEKFGFTAVVNINNKVMVLKYFQGRKASTIIDEINQLPVIIWFFYIRRSFPYRRILSE